MKFRVDRGLVLGLVFVLVAAVTLLISWSGSEDNIVRELGTRTAGKNWYMHETGQIKEMPMEEYGPRWWRVRCFPTGLWRHTRYKAIFVRSFTMDFIAAGGAKEKYGVDVSTDIEETQAFNEAVTDDIRPLWR